MIYGIQPLAKVLGESGCYWFSLCKAAEVCLQSPVDPFLEASRAIAVGTLRASDAFLLDPEAAFTGLTLALGYSWNVIKAGDGLDSAGFMYPLPLDYKCSQGEYDILRFERPNPEGGAPLPHFVYGNGKGGVSWDPWPGSRTVAEGKLISRRIIRRKA